MNYRSPPRYCVVNTYLCHRFVNRIEDSAVATARAPLHDCPILEVLLRIGETRWCWSGYLSQFHGLHPSILNDFTIQYVE